MGQPCDGDQLQMQAVRSSLVKSFLEAKIRLDEAAESLKVILDQPHPNRSQRIHEAGRKLSIARQEVTYAHTRLIDFIARDGVTPVA